MQFVVLESFGHNLGILEINLNLNLAFFLSFYISGLTNSLTGTKASNRFYLSAFVLALLTNTILLYFVKWLRSTRHRFTIQ